MKALVIALIALNLALAGVVVYHTRAGSDQISADHVQGARMDIQAGGLVHVTLGTSSTPTGALALNPRTSGTLVLTPRAAIQLHSALGSTIRAVQDAAKDQREGARQVTGI